MSKMFNLLKEFNCYQTCIALECTLMNKIDCGWELDTLKWCAIIRCLIFELHKPIATLEYMSTYHFNCGWNLFKPCSHSQTLHTLLYICSNPSQSSAFINFMQPLNASRPITLTVEGMWTRSRDVQSWNVPWSICFCPLHSSTHLNCEKS